MLGPLAHMQTFTITGMVQIQNVNYDWSMVSKLKVTIDQS